MARKKVERWIAYDDQRQCYYVTMDYGKDEAGKRQRKCATCQSLGEAHKKLEKFLLEKSRLTIVAPSRMTVGEWLDEWMEKIMIPNRAETTIYGYRKIIENHLEPGLGKIVLQELHPRDIQHYYAQMKLDERLSASTIRHHHDLLSCALRTAVKQELIRRNPAEWVDPPRVNMTEVRFYNAGELKRLCEVVEGTWLETVVKLAGYLGLRREEICGLRWSNVDFKNRKIHIREARTTAGAVIIQKETKNRSSARTLYMTDEIREMLRKEQKRQRQAARELGSRYESSGFVSVDQWGRAHSPNVVSQAFRRVVDRENLPYITLHGLRHTFATLASAQGAPLFEIAKVLGHSTPATTGKIYTHLLDQTHRPTLTKISAALDHV